MGFEKNRVKKKRETKKQIGDERFEKSVHNVLGGSFLSREKTLSLLPFLFFLTLMAILYISNIYVAESKKRQIEKLNAELKEFEYEFKSTKSELMFQSNQSQLTKRLTEKGIKESKVPPIKITVKKRR
ncbi:MAG: hypothetical protein K9G67_13825 [Bacteroidales bacterium]|nr:hypothetical protein [Bacteroidales bacterium]MCF8344780.1 hypothetical protein [Bacteroidales bacterium]MCF8352702.1 hypothetical protein [Bacteroidales bacterium]MCF8377431.1 hypothetical protein [Bacteroidales bacterium]MCF8401643.1 hypothetical protein [Bacteroidales bacterium]